MPRRYGQDGQGAMRRTWGGKLPEDFSAQEAQAFLSATDDSLHNGKEHFHMAKNNDKATPETAAVSPLKLEARAYPLEEPKGSTVAFAGVNINDAFAVNGIKVINGEKGMFVAMPGAKNRDGEYRDVAFPITAEARKQVCGVVLDAYARAVEKSQPELAAAAKSAREALEKPSLTGQIKDAAKDAKEKPAPAKDKAAPAQEAR